MNKYRVIIDFESLHLVVEANSEEEAEAKLFDGESYSSEEIQPTGWWVADSETEQSFNEQ